MKAMSAIDNQRIKFAESFQKIKNSNYQSKRTLIAPIQKTLAYLPLLINNKINPNYFFYLKYLKNNKDKLRKQKKKRNGQILIFLT